MPNFEVVITFVIWRDKDGVLTNYTLTSSLRYAAEYSWDDIKASIQKNHLEELIEKCDLDPKSVVYLSTQTISKNILGAYIQHIAGVN